MGLDIYLYRFDKPHGIKQGEIYTQEAIDAIASKTYQDMAIYDADAIENLCDSILDNSISIRHKVEIISITQVKNYIRRHADEIIPAEDYPVRNNTTLIYNVADRIKDIDVHRRNASQISPEAFTLEITLYDTQDERIGRIDKLFMNYDELQKSWIEYKTVDAIITHKTEVAYQRKGLTDSGWDLLPDNCVYDDSKERIEELCQEGLSEDFLDNFEEGKTALWAWW